MIRHFLRFLPLFLTKSKWNNYFNIAHYLIIPLIISNLLLKIIELSTWVLLFRRKRERRNEEQLKKTHSHIYEINTLETTQTQIYTYIIYTSENVITKVNGKNFSFLTAGSGYCADVIGHCSAWRANWRQFMENLKITINTKVLLKNSLFVVIKFC